MSHTEEDLDAFVRWERRTWEERAAAYGRAITGLTRGAADALLEAAEVAPAHRVLDVATGPGVVGLAARRRGAVVLAVDQALAMVQMARSAGLEAWRASAEHLPFRDAAFEAVVAGFLLNHLARPVASVAELARVGRLRVALSVWDVPAANPALGLFGAVVQEAGLADVVPAGPDAHRYADDAQLLTLLGDAGLDHLRVDRVVWSVSVDPGAWFDAVAAGTPRTGAVLAAAPPDRRAELRARYVQVARDAYGSGGGLVTLPATAVVGSGRPAGRSGVAGAGSGEVDDHD